MFLSALFGENSSFPSGKKHFKMIKKTEIIYLLFNDITQQEMEMICNLKTVGENTYIKM